MESLFVTIIASSRQSYDHMLYDYRVVMNRKLLRVPTTCDSRVHLESDYKVRH